MLVVQRFTCPYCWQPVETQVDPSGGSQDYYEDCPVCCHPLAIAVVVRGGAVVSFEALPGD